MHTIVFTSECVCALASLCVRARARVCVNQGKETEDKSSTLQQQQRPITVHVQTCCARIPGNQRLLYKSNYLPLILNISIQTASCICCSMLQISCYYLFRLDVFLSSWWLVIFSPVSIETQSDVSQSDPANKMLQFLRIMFKNVWNERLSLNCAELNPQAPSSCDSAVLHPKLLSHTAGEKVLAADEKGGEAVLCRPLLADGRTPRYEATVIARIWSMFYLFTLFFLTRGNARIISPFKKYIQSRVRAMANFRPLISG